MEIDKPSPDVFERNGFPSPSEGLTFAEAEAMRWETSKRFLNGEISRADRDSIEKAVSLTAMEGKYI